MRQGEEIEEPMSFSQRDEFVPSMNVDSKVTLSDGHDLSSTLSAAKLPLHENFKTEERSDDETCQDSVIGSHEQESYEAREQSPADTDYDYQLLLRDEEEEMMQQEWQELDRMDQESRELAILDELQQIHEEEYPDNDTMEAAQQEIDSMENFVEIDEEEDHFDFEGTPLSNDMQIQNLVATCDVRDREDRNCLSGCGENLGNESSAKDDIGKAACVVCLEAPRTHAYVPCGHFCVCFSCAKEQTKVKHSIAAASTCPVCKQPSTRVMRIFIP